MKKRKAWCFAALCLCCMLFSSCSGIQINAEDLMQPPMLTKEQTEIRSALEDALGTTSFRLKYPRTGNYRSAFVMHDLDADGKDEALVFYDLQITDTNVRMTVLKKTEDGWKANYSDSGKGSNVDRVDFCNMNSAAAQDIVIGWSQPNGVDKAVTVFSYAEGKLEQCFSNNWVSDMLIYDMNHDGLDELLLLRTGSGANSPSVKLVSKSGEKLKITSSVDLQESIARFERVQVGQLSDGVEAVFLDASIGAGKRMTTSILRYNSDLPEIRRLVDVVSQIPTEDQPNFLREQKTYCTDINADGKIEIPCSTYLPGYSSISEEKMYATEYVQLFGNAFLPMWYGIVNVEEGYRFEFPEEWQGLVSVKRQMETGELSFFVYDGKSPENDYRQLLRLRSVSASQTRDKFETENYYELGDPRGIYQYAAYVPQNAQDKELLISYTEVKKRFTLV